MLNYEQKKRRASDGVQMSPNSSKFDFLGKIQQRLPHLILSCGGVTGVTSEPRTSCLT